MILTDLQSIWIK